ncbi:MAG: biotin transporter BioY [Deltaproteobacteria bacterium]|jgi:biotin transport system substrate-specific component|nr:biotin transporter BioY [Deltaproteobacteria bacterium]
MTSSSISLNQARTTVSIAVWGALMAAGAYVAVPMGPVPITLQTFFIFLAGFVDGPKAALAALLYIGAGFLGLPVFTGGLAGPAVFLAPTVGYLLSFPLAAFIAGLGAKAIASSKENLGKSKATCWLKLFLLGILATIVIYVLGAIGLMINVGMTPAVALGANLIFIPGDALKIAAAASTALGLSLRAPFKKSKAKANTDSVKK